MRIIEKTVYQFTELSESAKETALSWFREGVTDFEWHEYIFEDFERIAGILGVELKQMAGKTMEGGTNYHPAIYFSGFCSQGDGACFAGGYEYAKESCKKIKEYAPKDTELHRIADELRKAQSRVFYQAGASIVHRGHYQHSGCMDISIDYGDNYSQSMGPDEDITQALRDLADWLYSMLEREYTHLTSDESCKEGIEANQYEFDESGNVV